MSCKDHDVQRGDCLPCMQDAVERLRHAIKMERGKTEKADEDNERLRARLAEAEHDAKQAHGVAQALERDAARYRWLRQRLEPWGVRELAEIDAPDRDALQSAISADVDAAIDAALERKP